MTVDATAAPGLVETLPVGRLLALDVGDRRVGAAVCDEGGLLVRPLTVFERGARAADQARIRRLLQEQRAVGLVVGYPLNDDGSAGPQAQQTARYAQRLAAVLDVPVMLWDERLSTFEAEQRLAAMSRRGRKAIGVDAVAAAVILESFLDHVKQQQPASPAAQSSSTSTG